MPPDDVIFAQPACRLNDAIFLFTSVLQTLPRFTIKHPWLCTVITPSHSCHGHLGRCDTNRNPGSHSSSWAGQVHIVCRMLVSPLVLPKPIFCQWKQTFIVVMNWYQHWWSIPWKSSQRCLRQWQWLYLPSLPWAQTRQASWQGRWAGSIDVPALNANIFVAATSRTNIHNKKGVSHHSSVYLKRCLWF